MVSVSQVHCDKLIPNDFDFKKLVPESFTNSSSNYASKEIKESDTFLNYNHHHRHRHHRYRGYRYWH
jgi:hypothetical protein